MHVGIATGFANHSRIEDARFVAEELTQLELAAELGFESIWITEHHFSDYSISPNPLMYLAYWQGVIRACASGRRCWWFPGMTPSAWPRRSSCWITYRADER